MRDRSRSKGSSTLDPIGDFLAGLRRRGHEPLLGNASGRVRFDLIQDGQVDHWLVTIEAGRPTASHASGRADCVVRADKGVFNRMARGEVNPTAALLRGEIVAEGDPELLLRLQRLFPGPGAADG